MGTYHSNNPYRHVSCSCRISHVCGWSCTNYYLFRTGSWDVPLLRSQKGKGRGVSELIDALSLHMAKHIKNVVPDHPASVAVLKHALAVILNLVFIISLTIIISIFTGNVIEAVTVMAAFAFLRQLTGGIHLKSGMGCVAVSTLLFTGLSFIKLDYNWTIGVTLVSMLLIFVFAPAGIERQTRIPPRYFPLLRSGALIVVSFNLWIANPFIAISFFVQSLSLINIRRWERSWWKISIAHLRHVFPQSRSCLSVSQAWCLSTTRSLRKNCLNNAGDESNGWNRKGTNYGH